MSKHYLVPFCMILCLPVAGCSDKKKSYSSTQPTENTMNPAVEVSTDDAVIVPTTPTDPVTTPATTTTKPVDYCGSLGIVGGTVATASDMVTKSTVRLIIGQGFCTGTIIGPNHISTAAHCLEEKPVFSTIQIQFGVTPVTDPNIKVKGYSVHPDFKGLNLENGYPAVKLFDVAVIAFTGKIPQGYAIAPVGSTANLQNGSEVILAGYGAYTDTDMQDRPLTQVKKAVALFDRNYKELQLAVGGQKGGCYGDSGGPSYIVSENGLCLKTLSTTTGPSRAGNGMCTQGGGTLMDITAYQGWMSCSFEKLASPLAYLLKDESKDACDRTTVTQ